ncbi:hypothetical protein RJ639_009638 [Escallonia herrerae]|uniref:RBR-type E3 ubiquitin transferase n=1 Tax=Escallonia herrerae TaxID=1293975 RepID=A0AA88VSX4_9ASTE|nr:hypothetical protein RJ639_009638 [Escallonia herrerae]
MDSDSDDMHDAYDGGYYSGGDADSDCYYGDDVFDNDDGAEYEFMDDIEDSPDPPATYRQINYTVLREEDIRQRQEDDITKICTVLSVSRVAACMLLRRYNWNVNNVHEAWFADEDRVRKVVGLLEKPVVQLPTSGEMTCGICFEVYPIDMIQSAACGHSFCSTCWAGYINTSINDGPGCLMLRCPDPSCSAAVDRDMVNIFASDGNKEKYRRYLVRSYIEDNRKTSSLEEIHKMIGRLCLGAWSEHGERTGGFYACNKYEAARQEGESRQKAEADLHQMRTVHLEKLSEIHSQPESQLKFIIEAWLQNIQWCSGEAEAGLERLHQCAEKDLQNYLSPDSSSDEFNNFRTKLAGLTSIWQLVDRRILREQEKEEKKKKQRVAKAVALICGVRSSPPQTFPTSCNCRQRLLCQLGFSQLLLGLRLPPYEDYPDWLKRDVSSEAKTNDSYSILQALADNFSMVLGIVQTIQAVGHAINALMLMLNLCPLVTCATIGDDIEARQKNGAFKKVWALKGFVGSSSWPETQKCKKKAVQNSLVSIAVMQSYALMLAVVVKRKECVKEYRPCVQSTRSTGAPRRRSSGASNRESDYSSIKGAAIFHLKRNSLQRSRALSTDPFILSCANAIENQPPT